MQLQSLRAGSRLKSLHRRILLLRLGDLENQLLSDESEPMKARLWKEALDVIVEYEL